MSLFTLLSAGRVTVSCVIVLLCAAFMFGQGDKSTVGQQLFFDKRLSADGTVSCASCHDPAMGFASRDTVAIGVRNQSGVRNAPTLLNAKLSGSYFWDGRARTLEEQAKQPLLNAPMSLSSSVTKKRPSSENSC